MDSDELAYLSGHAALELFRARELSPLELMRAVIDRAERVQPVVNAFTETYFEQALAAAAVAEARYLGHGAPPRALEGLPLAVKEEFRLAGTRRTSGSLLYRDRVDSETDVLIQRLLDAGAICHLKTTTPEFCIIGTTHSRLFGVTRNPWDPEFSPGGSSGGSAAALAAGAATLATGSDIAGSIRIPAACSGVVGYKPPYGRNPEIALYNLDYYSHSGPLARTVADCALMQNVTSGRDPCDIASLAEQVLIDPDERPDLRGWRIAYSLDLGFYEIDDAVARATREAVRRFADLGARVEEIDLGWTEEVTRAAYAYLAHLSGAGVARLLPAHREQLCDYTVAFAEASRASTAEDFFHAYEVAAEMYQGFGPQLERYEVFVCPTLAIPAPPADYPSAGAKVQVNGEPRVWKERRWAMTVPFNMLSRCPVLSVPSGRAPNGVPTGIQIVGRAYDDQRVFSAALAFEQAGPWLARPADRPRCEATPGAAGAER